MSTMLESYERGADETTCFTSFSGVPTLQW